MSVTAAGGRSNIWDPSQLSGSAWGFQCHASICKGSRVTYTGWPNIVPSFFFPENQCRSKHEARSILQMEHAAWRPVCALMGCTHALVLEAFELVLTAHLLLAEVGLPEASTTMVSSGTQRKLRKGPGKSADKESQDRTSF